MSDPEYLQRFTTRIVKSLPSRGEALLASAFNPFGQIENAADAVDTVVSSIGEKGFRSSAKDYLSNALSSPENIADLAFDILLSGVTRKIPALGKTSFDEGALAGLALENIPTGQDKTAPLGSELQDVADDYKRYAKNLATGALRAVSPSASSARQMHKHSNIFAPAVYGKRSP